MTHLRKTIASTLLWFLITLVGLDCFFRMAEIQSPFENRVVERVGLMYQPDFQLARFSEGFFLGRTNAYGCLGAGAAPTKPPDELRILILGDSYALGHTVFERHHFGREMERLLERATGRPTRVLNFARADFAVPNMYQHYRDFACQWEHDLALFFGNQSDLNASRQASASFYPYAVVEDDTLRFDYSFIHSRKSALLQRLEWWLPHVVLPRLLFEFAKVIDQGKLRQHLFQRPNHHSGVTSTNTGFRSIQRPQARHLPPRVAAPKAEPLVAVSRLVLDKLQDEPKVVFVFSGPVHPTLQDELAQRQLPTIDLNPVFAEISAAGRDPYYWRVTGERGHWNHETHVAIGRALGEAVLAHVAR